jgi:serine/threonine protein phosphatase PrpC
MSFLTDSLSRVGGREANEDYCDFRELENVACWVVADGLGGHRGGETASRIAVDAVLASFSADPEFSSAALHRHLEAAQRDILKAQKEQPVLSSMRTTIVVAITDHHNILWAHAGDSRLYVFEGGRVVFCTKDHSVVQAMVNAGELSPGDARHHEDRNRLLRTLGNGDGDLRPSVRDEKWPLSRGTALLLCTDGFWEHVTEDEMEVDLAKAGSARDWLARMEGRLLERVGEDHDNYTALAVLSTSQTIPPAPALSPCPSPERQSRHALNNSVKITALVLGLILSLTSFAAGWLLWELRELKKETAAIRQQLNDLKGKGVSTGASQNASRAGPRKPAGPGREKAAQSENGSSNARATEQGTRDKRN